MSSVVCKHHFFLVLNRRRERSHILLFNRMSESHMVVFVRTPTGSVSFMPPGGIQWYWLPQGHSIMDIPPHLIYIDLAQIIQVPAKLTQTSKTLIDLVFFNRPDRITKSINLLTGISDHNVTLMVRKLTRNIFKNHINVQQYNKNKSRK